jgi:hypothetical protein
MCLNSTNADCRRSPLRSSSETVKKKEINDTRESDDNEGSEVAILFCDFVRVWLTQ